MPQQQVVPEEATPQPEDGDQERQQAGNGGATTAGPGEDDLKEQLKARDKRIGQLINDLGRVKKNAADRQKLADALKEWNAIAAEHDVEPEQVKELLAARREADMTEAKSRGEIDKLLENQAGKFRRDLGKKDEEIKALNDALTAKARTIDALTIDVELNRELGKLVEPALMKGVFALHRPKVTTIEDSDAPYGIRVVVDVDGDHMSVKDYLKRWAEDDQEAQAYLISNRSTGGGAPAAGRIGVGIPRMRRSEMSPKQISEFLSKYGQEQFNKLPR